MVSSERHGSLLEAAERDKKLKTLFFEHFKMITRANKSLSLNGQVG
jgi:hypothetical protein